MRRRGFLGLGLAAAAADGGGRRWGCSDVDGIIAILDKRLDYLHKDPAGVRAFAHDLAALGSIDPKRLHVVAALKPLYTRLALSEDNRLTHALHHGEERVTSSYLLSSDFFVNGSDMSRVVHYLGLYDPLLGCRNPFARLGEA